MLYTLSRLAFSDSFTAARYLLPLYAALPLVFGVLWEAATPVVAIVGTWWAVVIEHGRGTRRHSQVDTNQHDASANGLAQLHSTTSPELSREWADHLPRSPRYDASLIRSALASAGLMLLLGFALYGGVATVRYAGDGTRYALPAPPRDQQLLAALAAHHITRYISDYWTCYRLVFESGERLRCGVRDGVDNTLTHNGAVNRYLPYLLEVEYTPHPAYIFAAGSSWDSGFASWAASQRLPHENYTRIVVAGYAIYYYPAGQG
ncbi:MAG: hypothetical protein ACHQ4H_16045 [Ktedonobacterales bacterium]